MGLAAHIASPAAVRYSRTSLPPTTTATSRWKPRSMALCQGVWSPCCATGEQGQRAGEGLGSAGLTAGVTNRKERSRHRPALTLLPSEQHTPAEGTLCPPSAPREEGDLEGSGMAFGYPPPKDTVTIFSVLVTVTFTTVVNFSYGNPGINHSSGRSHGIWCCRERG